MVQGVVLCNTFVTKKTLTISTVVIGLALIVPCVCLGIGGSMVCHYNPDDYYDFYHVCESSRTSLFINGGILMGLGVLALVGISVLWCRLREAPARPMPIVTQPYAMPVQVAVMPNTANLYPQAPPGYPQAPPGYPHPPPQHLPTATTLPTGAHSSLQQPAFTPAPYPPQDLYPQKQHPEATTTNLP
ncbi:hypothetical protein GWK47_009013 [Chionoecetes opilio]|uniref:Uncharacterized protein n=1 Tax=Chionoecetes opilio TaxID=41210 RepID=A0A8J4Y3S6_CHIOP|nr:hypothetical protein GWK47_009013 [Chionoecetes opilio]